MRYILNFSFNLLSLFKDYAKTVIQFLESTMRESILDIFSGFIDEGFANRIIDYLESILFIDVDVTWIIFIFTVSVELTLMLAIFGFIFSAVKIFIDIFT